MRYLVVAKWCILLFICILKSWLEIAEFFDVMWEYGRMGLYEHG